MYAPFPMYDSVLEISAAWSATYVVSVADGKSDAAQSPNWALLFSSNCAPAHRMLNWALTFVVHPAKPEYVASVPEPVLMSAITIGSGCPAMVAPCPGSSDPVRLVS